MSKRGRPPLSNRAMKTLGALLLVSATPGCALSTPGELGKLEFRILVDDQAGGSSEILPIAPNTEVVLRVTRPGGQAALVTDYLVDQPWVLSVTRESHDMLRVKTRAVGDTKLSVRAAGQDDRIMLNVLAPVAARVWGPVMSKEHELLIAMRGSSARFPLTISGAGRQRVLALGVPPPIRVIPEGAATITPPGPRAGTLLRVVFDRAGIVRLQGDLEEALVIHVLADNELSQLELVKLDSKPKPAALAYRIHGIVGGTPAAVVSSGAELTIDTPEVCINGAKEVTAASALVFGEGTIALEAVNAGRCTGSVTFAGKSATFSEEMAPAAKAAP